MSNDDDNNVIPGGSDPRYVSPPVRPTDVFVAFLGVSMVTTTAVWVLTNSAALYSAQAWAVWGAVLVAANVLRANDSPRSYSWLSHMAVAWVRRAGVVGSVVCAAVAGLHYHEYVSCQQPDLLLAMAIAFALIHEAIGWWWVLRQAR